MDQTPVGPPRRFLAALGAATAFRAEEGKLLLLDEGGRVRARLAALPR